VRDFPFTGYAVSLAFARKNRALLDNFLLAYRRGVDFFHDRANRAEAVTIAAKYVKVDRADLEATFDFYHQLKMFDRAGLIPNSGIENLLKILKEFGELDGAADISRFYDPTIITPEK
jgi:ABC-type nitrate/sulfonate/bicarbonate transport system substrate-binding protein